MKQMIIVTSVLVTLGAAMSGALSKNDQQGASSAQPQAISSDRLVAKLSASPASVYLARPL
jgi:hypothetical protein